MLRQWGGIVDMTGDRSPIIGPSPVPGIFLNCGWGTGGFKAIPGSGWATAEMLAKGTPGELAGPFGLERFARGPDDRRERRRGGGALMASGVRTGGMKVISGGAGESGLKGRKSWGFLRMEIGMEAVWNR